MAKSEKLTFTLTPGGDVAYLKMPLKRPPEGERKVAGTIRLHGDQRP